MIFLYFWNKRYLLTELPPRKMIVEFPGSEIIRTFQNYESYQLYLERTGIIVEDLGVKKNRKFDKAHREKLREQKLGDKNPNKKGLSENHRKNISRGMKGKNVAQFNVNFGKKTPLERRIKISTQKRLRNRYIRRRWVVSDLGEEHLVLSTFILPAGWIYGRKRNKLRRR